MSTLPAFVQDLGDGIYAIDTGFQRPAFDAAFLIIEAGRAAFIDTGTNHALPRHLAALQALGVSTEAVDWVIPTHVHLDHAGGAGAMMQVFPRARLVVHPRGVRHMIDPRALYAGALAVYGQQEMDRSYGTLIAVDAGRVQPSSDGGHVDLAGRRLDFIDTPGHAKHHHCIWDERTRGWFTGDTFGLSYREFDTARGAFIIPTSTPIQFDPPALKQSVSRMLAREPAAIYLTHFGRVTGAARLGDAMLARVDEMVAEGSALRTHPARHTALKQAFGAIYLRHARDHGVALPDAEILDLLALDIELNAQGFAVWLDRPSPPNPVPERLPMRLLHTMLRVGDLPRSIAFYTQVLGMELLRTTDRPEQKYTLAFVGYGRNPDHAEIELTYNHGVHSYDLGSAYGHIAIGVPDVTATCAALREKAAALGGAITREPGPVKGGSTFIAFITDPDGYKIELIQRDA